MPTAPTRDQETAQGQGVTLGRYEHMICVAARTPGAIACQWEWPVSPRRFLVVHRRAHEGTRHPAPVLSPPAQWYPSEVLLYIVYGVVIPERCASDDCRPLVPRIVISLFERVRSSCWARGQMRRL
jgi:hypothetical protein